MKKIFFLAALLVLLAQSCIISLHPLYTDDVITYNELLEGRWRQGPLIENDDDYVYWDFERKEKGYQVLRYYQGDTLEYEAVLVRLGDYLFMDFYRELEKQDDLARVLPTHNFLKVSISGEELKLTYFDEEYLKRLFKERKIRIKHERVNSDIVLTADSKELQQFILKYADDEQAFSESFEYLTKISD